MTDRLYRSPSDRVIAGVAGGLATWLNLDPSLVRVAWVLLAIVSGGLFVLVYIVMMIVVPLPPPGWIPQARGAAGSSWQGGPPAPGPGGQGAIPGWQPGAGTTWGAPPAAGSAPGTGSAPGSGSAPGAEQGSGWTTPAQPWVAPRVDPGNAGIVLGVVLVLLGAFFLVDQYVHIDWDLLWPVVVIVLGVALIAGAMRRSSGSGS